VWMKQAIEEYWNVMLAHNVTDMWLLNHKDTGSKACHMFQIIMDRKGVRQMFACTRCNIHALWSY
jgi:desulfoferrodoxin (superoxide reductase-like protein)